MKPVLVCVMDKINKKKLKKYARFELENTNLDYTDIGLIKNTGTIVSEELKECLNKNLVKRIKYAIKNNLKIHLIGDLTKDLELLHKIDNTCNEMGFSELYIHVFDYEKPNFASLRASFKVGKIATATDINLIKKDLPRVYEIVTNKIDTNDMLIFYNIDLSIFLSLIDMFKDNDINYITMISCDNKDNIYHLEKTISFFDYLDKAKVKTLRCCLPCYILDGYQKKNYQNILDRDILDISDFNDYDFVILKTTMDDMDKIKKFNGIKVIIGFDNDKLTCMYSSDLKPQNSIRELMKSILELLGVKTNDRFDLYGYIFRIISILFILSCAVYYVTRLLHVYITK